MTSRSIVWSNLRRAPARNVLIVLSIGMAFLLYGVLSAIRSGFEHRVDVGQSRRLVVAHRASIMQFLPSSYQARIQKMEGVELVSHAIWFGGVYQDGRNFFVQLAVDPATYLAAYPEYVLAPDRRQAWLADRTGAIAGKALADRLGWKVGDRIPLRPTIWQRSDGAEAWDFTLQGIYTGATPTTDASGFLFHHAYLDEGRTFGQGTVGWYLVKVADTGQTARLAREIEREFAQSLAPTRATTEAALIQAYAQQIGNVGAITRSIVYVVFFTCLVVAASAMSQSVRERLRELAILRAIGFSATRVAGLLLAESLTLAIAGGGAGLLLAFAVLSQDPTGGALPHFVFSGVDLARGLPLVLLLGLVAAAEPAVRVLRMNYLEGLRRL